MSKQSDVLSQVSEFFARYLHCSEQQRTVLALWVLHAWCSRAAQVTPYLSIRSAYKQSGKTLCLQLLGLLCEDSALAAGFTASSLTQRMKHNPVSAVLFDECHATIGTRARSKAPALRALLAGSFHRGLGGGGAAKEHSVFCPKAFAGMGQLPDELADRSIPMILEPPGLPAFMGFDHDGVEVLGPRPQGLPRKGALSRDGVGVSVPAGVHVSDWVPGASATAAYHADRSEANKPSAVKRFHLRRATQEAGDLKRLLSAWAKENLQALEDMTPYNDEDFPPHLSPRRQDLCEPLLQLADALGGEWPARSRQALLSLFQQGETFDLQASLQLLADVHACFAFHGFPERLSTITLLDWVQTLPSRPWDIDGPMTAYRLSRLLAAFDLRPRVQRIGNTSPARGYQLHDFLEPWHSRLGFAPPNWAAPGQAIGRDWSARLQEWAGAAENAACNGVTEAQAWNGAAQEPAQDRKAELWREYLALEAELAERNQQSEAQPSEIANSGAVCNGLAHNGAVSIGDGAGAGGASCSPAL